MVCVSVRLLVSVYKKKAVCLEHRNCDVHVPTFQRLYLCFRFFFSFFFYESVLLLDNILKVMIYAFFIIFYAFYGYILRQSVCRIFNALCLVA